MFGKKIDRLVFFIILICLISFVLALLNMSILIIILVDSILLLSALVIIFLDKNKPSYNISYRDFIIKCILSDDDYIKSILSEVLYPDYKFKNYDSYCMLNDVAIFFCLKFSSISYEQISNVYKTCKHYSINKAVIIVTAKDRKVLSLFKYLDNTEIKIMTLKPIYKQLKKHKMLPSFSKKLPVFSTLKQAITLTIKKSNIKLFVFTSIITSILSYFTIYKTYYFVISIISLILAIVSLIYDKVSNNTNVLK